ncbi:MAG: PKD domain-containing protein [Solirubrobacteraceae bacterium]
MNYTIRSEVTATTASGSASATSAAIGPIQPLPPTASFGFSPAAPVTAQSVHFDASASSCPVGPCSFSWADDPPSGGTWPLGSGQTLDFTFQGAGTKYVTLTVTDALNRTATVEHDVVVATAPSAPSNTAPPVISGTAQQGQTLTVSNGSWSGSPTSYAYQWRDCNSSGAACTNITGATGAAYVAGSADVGHTLLATVTATNSAGTGAASSASTAVVTAAAGSGTQTLNCFSAPGRCGYPDPASGNVGVANCSSLPTWSPSDLPAGTYSVSGNMVNITGANVTISGYNLSAASGPNGNGWLLYINGAQNFTFENSCLSYSGSSFGGGQGGSTALWGTAGATGMTVKNSTIIAPGCTASATTSCTSSGVDETLVTGGANATVENDILAGAVEPINGLGAGSLIQDNYIVANGYMSGNHSEDVYESQVAGITINHNTLLNPFDQSGVIFGDTLGQACQNQFAITNNLMAGAGYVLYSCSSASGAGTSKLVFTGNDIARCDGTSTYDSSLGGDYCGSTAPSNSGSSTGAGSDPHGYWPQGGFFGLVDDTYCSGGGGVTWSRNFWDDTGAGVSCP